MAQVRDGEVLAQQYGGRHTGKWVSTLPAAWIPYVQLARLSPPAGVFLVFFPHLFGVVQISILHLLPPEQLIHAAAMAAAGSFFLSNTIHGWNDMIDAPFDKEVSRTKDRPIVRGAISPIGAFTFTVSQALLATAILLLLPSFAITAAIPSIVANFYYPWSKRHTYFAQFVLGVSLGWGVVVGNAIAGATPWDTDVWAPTACLLISSILWTVIYDTIYAFQDIVDDTRLGLKSTAVLFGRHTKSFLWTCLGVLLVALSAHGRLLQLGYGFHVIAVGGSGLSLGAMISKVNLDDPFSCWWWFRYGFWLAAGAISGGLFWDYSLLRL